jgi:hypothetical protein
MADAEFAMAVSDLRAEVLEAPEFPLRSVTDAVVRASLSLIEIHSLNATDALILRPALDAAGELRARGDALVLVASDLRLIAAAHAEGVVTFNPEAQDQADLDALLSA